MDKNFGTKIATPLDIKLSLVQNSQHSTAQHSTAQHSTAQHSTAQHSTAQAITLLEIIFRDICILNQIIQFSQTGKLPG